MAATSDDEWVVLSDDEETGAPGSISTWSLVGRAPRPDSTGELEHPVESIPPTPSPTNDKQEEAPQEESTVESDDDETGPLLFTPTRDIRDQVSSDNETIHAPTPTLRNETVNRLPEVVLAMAQPGFKVGHLAGMMLLYWAVSSPSLASLFRGGSLSPTPQSTPKPLSKNRVGGLSSLVVYKTQPLFNGSQIIVNISEAFRILETANPIARILADQYRTELADLFKGVRELQQDVPFVKTTTTTKKQQPNEERALMLWSRNMTIIPKARQDTPPSPAASVQMILKLAEWDAIHVPPARLSQVYPLANSHQTPFFSTTKNRRALNYPRAASKTKRLSRPLAPRVPLALGMVDPRLRPLVVQKKPRAFLTTVSNSLHRLFLEQELSSNALQSDSTSALSSSPHGPVFSTPLVENHRDLSRALVLAPSRAVGRHYDPTEWALCKYVSDAAAVATDDVPSQNAPLSITYQKRLSITYPQWEGRGAMEKTPSTALRVFRSPARHI
eukprot:m.436236 g.436236  ORF g.436236 m.436236 type:complete len:500 (+) comp17954_c0_seq1:245-1744(+)